MKNQALKTIFVNPVPRISVQGRDRQTYTIINPKTGETMVTKSMNKTKEFGVGSEYSFPYNPTTNRLETGLDVSVTNPFYKLSVEETMEKYNLRHSWMEPLTKLVEQSEIKKQTLLEIKHDVEPGHYTSAIAGNATIFNATKSTKIPESHNYLQHFKIILYDGPNRFTDETPRGELAIELINLHKKIAKTKQEINTARHDYYISEENEAEQEKSRKQDIINDAIYNLVKLQKEAGSYKNYQTAILLTTEQNQPLIKGDAVPERVKNELSAYISNDTKYQIDNVEKFNRLLKLLDDKEGRERFNIMYLVQQAINTNIIGIKDGYYIWYSKAGTPNIYKHSNYDKFVSLLVAEFKNANDESVTNWYNDLYNEVKSKNIWVE
jgi:hypothetical protein